MANQIWIERLPDPKRAMRISERGEPKHQQRPGNAATERRD